jgi:hypothetical protein
MTPALAEGILALDFPEDDAIRIAELNIRASFGRVIPLAFPSGRITFTLIFHNLPLETSNLPVFTSPARFP